jgi:sulfoxide reductase heme-binding subunit YedZ
MSPELIHALWYLGRGSGLVSLLLLTVVLGLGIVTKSRRRPAGLTPAVVMRIHRNAGMLSVVFLTIHIVSLVLDPYAQLRIVDTVIPFGGGYRPLYVGLGTLAFDLLVAVMVTSVWMRKFGARTWRAVHWLAYACWPTAFLHGLGAGSDSGRLWSRAIAVACFAVVATAVGWRLSDGFGQRPTIPGKSAARARREPVEQQV